MNVPMISVIIPVYNVESYLNKCLDSVLAQSFSDYEIILVDDGSTDKSAEICKAYQSCDHRIKYYYKENGGLSSARNFGLKVSKGAYVTFIDSDDYVDFDYLSTLYRLVKDNKADMSTCFYNVESVKGVRPWACIDTVENLFNSRNALLCLLCSKEIDVCAVCKLYRRSLFDEVEFPEGKLFEDVGTTYKLLDRAKTVAVCHIPLYHYVMRDDSIVHKVDKRVFDRSTLASQALLEIKRAYTDDEEMITAAERYKMTHSLSTLRCVDLSDTRQREKAQNIRKDILSHRKQLKKNPCVSKLDRIALLVLPCGLSAYQWAWRVFTAFRGK